MQKMPEPREEGRQGGKTLCRAARGKPLDVPGVLRSGRRRDTEEATSGGAASAWQAGLQMPDCDPRAVQVGHGGRRVQCQAHDTVRLQPAAIIHQR